MNEDVTENDLIAMDPALIMEWIDHVSRERPGLAAAFNWLGTAEAAQLRAHQLRRRHRRIASDTSVSVAVGDRAHLPQ